MQNNQNKNLVLIEDLGTISPKETSKQKRRYGIYKCFCGVEFKAITQNVKKGKTKSCGCFKKDKVKERFTSHGLGRHKLYNIWNSMIQRCTNPKIKNYKNYGGRGITVCNEWLSINNFINDMFPTYKYGLSIDRIDNNKGYSKSNCRWTTPSIQTQNTRLIHKNNTSGYRGVSFNRNRKKFQSQIMVNSKYIYLGLFDTDIESAKAYNKYVIENNLEHTLNNL